MFKRRYLVLFLCAFLSLSSPSHTRSQENADWELVLYAVDKHQIVIVQAQGITETVQLPESIPHPPTPSGLGKFISVSPNRRYIAYKHNDSLFLYDLQNENFFDLPVPSVPAVAKGASYQLGDFSPDSSRFVFGFQFSDDGFESGLMSFAFDSDAFSLVTTLGQETWYPLHVEWRENGVYFQDAGNPVEPHLLRRYFRWVPGQETVEPTFEFADADGKISILENTGELIVATSNYDYPHSGQSGYASVAQENVLHYYRSGRDYMAGVNEVVLYHALDVPGARWVLDGEAVIIFTQPRQLVFRDGTSRELEDFSGRFLGGISDGWLNFEENAIYHTDINLDKQIVTEFDSERFFVLESPSLGNSGLTAFVGIPAYDWGASHCDNGVPSTIEVGSRAQQITSEEQRIFTTNEPARIGIAIVSPEDKLSVLDGPECVDGIPWWQVYHESEGIAGWMPEHTSGGARILEQRGPASEAFLEGVRQKIGSAEYYAEEPDYACEGFFLSVRLNVGETAYVTEGPPNNIRSKPLMDAELTGQIPGGESFEVIGGPACQDDVVWWEVEYEGVTGWTGEGIRNIYWTQPEPSGEETVSTVEATQVSQCPGFLPSRLTVGQTGRVTPGAANNVRAEPLSSAELVGQIPGGESFTVLAGPACQDTTAWWQVDYNGLIGWTQEGQGDTYWLEP